MMLDAIQHATAIRHGEALPLAMRIKMVSTAEEAIGVLYAEKYDLALVDVHLPAASGYELAQTFFEQFADSGTVFVACSSDDLDAATLQRFGIHDVLPKPVTMSSLRHMINKWMPRHELPNCIIRSPKGGLVRAMYVEDCPVSASAGMHMLQALGIQIETATTGGEALDKLRSRRCYHLIIIDLSLPDMSGYAVCSAYAAYCVEMGISQGMTLALTAGMVDSPGEDFGFSKILVKPLSSVTIIRLIRQWLGKALDPAEMRPTATSALGWIAR